MKQKLTKEQFIKVKDKLVGTEGQFMWTGMLVDGVIDKIEETEFSFVVYYSMFKLHVWGNDTYYKDSVWVRKEDWFGPLSKSFFDI